MFDIDTFLSDCIAARTDSTPQLAIREVLDAACSRPELVAAALPPERGELSVLHSSPDLTVLKVVWTPGMSFRPHNHRMWAAIGIYTGGEDNSFYRRDPEHGLAPCGGRAMRPSDVCVLGHDVIHAVTNPTRQHAGAIHVYGGDLLGAERSEWDPDTLEEQPYDVAAMRAYFEAQNALTSAVSAPDGSGGR